MGLDQIFSQDNGRQDRAEERRGLDLGSIVLGLGRQGDSRPKSAVSQNIDDDAQHEISAATDRRWGRGVALTFKWNDRADLTGAASQDRGKFQSSRIPSRRRTSSRRSLSRPRSPRPASKPPDRNLAFESMNGGRPPIPRAITKLVTPDRRRLFIKLTRDDCLK